MRTVHFIIAAIGICLLGTWASAQAPATTYAYQYIAQQSIYTAPINSDVTVNLYLRETNSDQSTHSLLANEHGLTSAGVQVAFTTGDSTSIITASADNTGTPPTGFDDSGNTATFTPATAMISESTDPDPFGTDLVGVAAGTQTAGVSDVFLGFITIHTSSTPGVSSTFSVATTDATIGATFTNDNAYDLDNNASVTNPPDAASLYSNAQATTFTVSTNPVPEPMALGGIMLLSLLARRRR
jgi:hypothetical protein